MMHDQPTPEATLPFIVPAVIDAVIQEFDHRKTAVSEHDVQQANLRNRVAHGLIRPEAITGDLVRLLIHTLLVFGVWKELAERR